MKYDVISIDDRCSFDAPTPFVAMMVCTLAGGGRYVLKNDKGENLLVPRQNIQKALHKSAREVEKMISKNEKEIYKALTTVMPDIPARNSKFQKKAKTYADNFAKILGVA